MFIEDLLGGLQIENDQIECKGRLNREDVIGWLKTIAGFANAKGGNFYIGVEDKSNKLIGFDKKEADNERNYFNNMVNEHLEPRPQMSITFKQYLIKDKERYIICVYVPESTVKPIILKYKNVPSIYIRRDGFTNGASYEEIIEMSIKSKNTQYDVMVSDVKYDSSKFEILRNFYSEHNDGNQLKEKMLQSMGFYNEEGYLTNGAVLFMDGYDGKKTEVQCSAFSGFTKGSERIVSINRYNGDLISSIKFMMEFVNLRMNHSMIKKEDTRINIDSYPHRALLEGLINAVAHRDYYLDRTQIQVDMFKDRLEISSPGSFYRGEPIPKTYDLSGIISKRRNEIICAILVACNVMEAAGTGFDKIVEDYSLASESHRPYICSYSDHFTLVLPDLTYTEGVDDETLPKLSFATVVNGSNYDQKILSYCYSRERKISDIAKYLGISDSSYLRKQILGNLENQGYLIKSKISSAIAYKTNPQSVIIL